MGDLKPVETVLSGTKKTKASFDPHTVLVRFKKGADAGKVAKFRKMTLAGLVDGTDFVKIKSEKKAQDALKELSADPAVAEVVLDYRREMTITPNDPAYKAGYQKHLSAVRMPLAWDRQRSATGQIVAVVDTGIDSGHPDLSGKVVAGYNAVSPGASTRDTDGHGTMVAGVIAASTNNSVGVAGVTWNGRVMPIKVFSGQFAQDSHIAAGVNWAVKNGAKVINLSLGGPGESPLLHTAIKNAVGKGVVVVASSGNTGGSAPQYPAAYPEVIAVGATNNSANLTYFSSWGDHVDLVAPGWDIFTLYSRQTSCGTSCLYAIPSGTSFSAPIVSGVAALVKAKYPSYTPQQVMNRLKGTARDAGPRGIDPYYGHGMLDAYAALGGAWTTDYVQRGAGTGEPNDSPARATVLTTSVNGTIGMEGDVDWYKYEVTAPSQVTFRVTPPEFDSYGRAQNFDPVLTVYDPKLRLLGEVDGEEYGSIEQLSLTLSPGTYYAKVTNFNGSYDSRAYQMQVLVASVNVAPFIDFEYRQTGQTFPETVAIGDVTGDGRNDVMLTTSSYFDPANDYKLFVFAQKPDGTLDTGTKYDTRIKSSDEPPITVLDANGDGRKDVAIGVTDGVEIFYQNESGLLDAGVLVQGTSNVGGLNAADMDGDGDEDLVVVTDGNIVLLTQETDGSFTPSPIASGGRAGDEVELGDVNGDNRIDVVTVWSEGIRVHLAGEEGWTTTDHPTGLGYGTTGIEVADVTGDGRADVLSANDSSHKLSIFKQDADGSLAAPLNLPAYDSPIIVEAGDWDGDGRLDVIVGHNAGPVSVFRQQSNGTLAPYIYGSASIAQHPSRYAMAVGDFSGDGKVDLASAANYNNGLFVAYNGHIAVTGTAQWPVQAVSPADFATGVSMATKPTVTFAEAVSAASVSGTTVRLVHGKSGGTVAATVSYDAGSRTATLTPAAALHDNAPYRIVVSGVKDTDGNTLAKFSSTFITPNVAPPAAVVTVKNGYRSTTLSWPRPNISDLDKVIVRMSTTATAPSSPTTGTAVYSGTGTSVTVSGLTGKTYSFSVWVKDRTGKLSPVVTKKIKGTSLTASGSSSIRKGTSVKVGATLKRLDNGAVLTGQTVKIYGRKRGSSTWVLLATKTTGSTGKVSFTHTPSATWEYQFRYTGTSYYIGSRVTKTVSVYS